MVRYPGWMAKHFQKGLTFQRAGIELGSVNGVLVLASLIVAACRYVWPGRGAIGRPLNGTHDSSWWAWWDQGKYLDAARAWAEGNLDPAQHWYLPGYPLLGAPFVRLMPAQPFEIPDALCLLATLWLFTRLAGWLAPNRRWMPGVAALVFLAANVFWTRLMDAWITPWTTTPAAPLTLAALLATIAFMERPRSRSAFAAGVLGASVGLFRPADAVALILSIAPFIAGATLLSEGTSWQRVRMIGCAALGGLIVGSILLATHAAIYGFARSPYLIESGRIGFEWRLIPIRWVTLFISPRPLFAEGYGLARTFWWIVPGLAGIVVALTTSRRIALARHALVIATVLLHCAYYLAYRDLHPTGLWRFNNYHYFKWVIPVFDLYATLLPILIVRSARSWRLVATAVATIVAAFCWQARFVPEETGSVEIAGPHALRITDGFPRVSSGIMVKANASFEAAYFGRHEMRIGDQTFHVYSDFRIFPEGDLVLIVPLRPMPPGVADITLDSGVTIDQAAMPIAGTQRVVPSLPCWFRAICPDF